MLIDELKEQLSALKPDLETIKIFWAHADFETKFKNLEQQTHQENFWQNPDQTNISKELQRLRTLRDNYIYVTSAYSELNELMDLFAQDEQELQKLSDEIKN
jgi:hypothetical protein